MIKKLVDIEEVKVMLSELLQVAMKENFSAEDTIEHAMSWLDRRFEKSKQNRIPIIDRNSLNDYWDDFFD